MAINSNRARTVWAVCVAGLLLLGNAALVQAQQDPPRLRETLQALKLTPEQTEELRGMLPKYRGRYGSDAFRVALLGILTAEQAEQLDELKHAWLPQPRTSDLVIRKNVQYLKRDGVEPKLLSLDIYRSREAEEPLPVMVMIHGGGWRIGDKSNRACGIDKGRFFADEGYVFVSVNYRLSPAVQHPAHVEDVAAALAWVHDHIGDHGGDPERMFVMGHSAGAHLAALVSTDERRLQEYEKPLSIVKGTILLDGAGYDVAAQMRLKRLATSSMYLNAFTDDEAVQRDASPIRHVAAGKEIPPFLIIPIASRADSKLQSQRLAAALRKAGTEARVYIAKGKTHGTVNTEIGTKDDAPTAEILAFLKTANGTPAAGE